MGLSCVHRWFVYRDLLANALDVRCETETIGRDNRRLGGGDRQSIANFVAECGYLANSTAAANATIECRPGLRRRSQKLLILPEDEPPLPPYRVEWRSAEKTDSKPIAIDGLIPEGPSGFFGLYLNTRYLEPGRYELRVNNPVIPGQSKVDLPSGSSALRLPDGAGIPTRYGSND